MINSCDNYLDTYRMGARFMQDEERDILRDRCY